MTAEGTTEHDDAILNMDERVEEIAKMLSGSNISQAAIDNAKNAPRPYNAGLNIAVRRTDPHTMGGESSINMLYCFFSQTVSL